MTGAEKGEKWSVGPLREIKVKRKRLCFFAWGGVFSLDPPFNGRPQAHALFRVDVRGHAAAVVGRTERAVRMQSHVNAAGT